MKQARSLVLLLGVFCAVLPAFAASPRVVAVGDVHGAYEEFTAVLKQAGLVDGSGRWSGGDTVLVQTGDVVDRGPDSRKVLDLLMTLERDARKQKGRVIPLLGNHEIMNMTGDLRYVSKEEYAAFAGPNSEKLRERAWQEYVRFMETRAARRKQPRPEPGEAEQKTWMERYPPGFFEHREAFGPTGEYGRWLRRRDAVALVDEVVFLHGGLNPQLPFRSVSDLNERIRAELTAFDTLWQALVAKKIIWRYMGMHDALSEVRDELAAGTSIHDDELGGQMKEFQAIEAWMINHPQGPFWYRAYADEQTDVYTAELDGLLKRFKASRVVVGHTVTGSRRIEPRLGNRVFLIDTGMLPGYKGRPSALEIQEDRFTAVYTDGKQALLPAAGGGSSSARPPLRSPAHPIFVTGAGSHTGGPGVLGTQ